MKQKPYDMNATPNLNVITLVEMLLTTQKQAYIVLLSIEQKLSKTSPPTSLTKIPEKPKVEREVLRKLQVMDILKISESTYYRHIRNGILVPHKLGNRNYFYFEDLAEALEYSKIHGYI